MDEANIAIRKHRDNMVVSGKWVIILGIWETFKILVLLLWEHRDYTYALIAEEDSDISMSLIKTVMTVMIFIFSSFILLIYIYIGRRSIRCGKGRKTGRLFLFFSFFIGIIELFEIPRYFIGDTSEISDTSIATFLIDLTGVFIIYQIIYSYICIQILEKKEKK
ncbi:MAG: hypothetical protein K6A23_11455 [Butyrivibrio sp.]|nr:hypothetical protein [Butyrivibrio sp.]